MTDVIVIGGGPAGLTASVYALRSGLSVKILEAEICGGQLLSVADIENFPSISSITGWQLARNMQDQAVNKGAEVIYGRVIGAEKSSTGFSVKTDKNTYEANSIIIANGVKRRKLNCSGEARLSGKGVSWCAVCDGRLYRGRTAAVVGGGNSAAEDALYLASICEKVYLIHRRDTLRADEALQRLLFKNEKIELVFSATVEKFLGENKLEGIIVKQNNQLKTIEVDAAFEAIGLIPDNSAFTMLVDLDDGYILADEGCVTKTPGVFAAGDTRSKNFRQIVTAAADGALAAKAAFDYINSIK